MDFEETIKDYEFTKRAVRGIRKVVDSEDFEEMDSAMIFKYLSEEMELVSFCDYLKRYLYERARMQQNFRSIPDKVFQEMIQYSFEENRAPRSFVPTTAKWSNTVKRWLTQDSVRRNVIFLLGFGLKMSAEDVSAFLTRVIREQDFDFEDPQETVFWYCYQNGLPYAKAVQLLQWFGQLAPGRETASRWFQTISQTQGRKLFRRSGNGFEGEKPRILYPQTEKELQEHLYYLRCTNAAARNKERARQQFWNLYQQGRGIIAGIYQEDEAERRGTNVWTIEQVGPADVEKFLCSGMPMNPNGNLTKISGSTLSKHFQQKRMSRQRIDAIFKGTQEVERFDLITLLFFLNSMPKDDEFPNVRCVRFIGEVNDMLRYCGMNEIYPPNGYEAFILMCMLTEWPLEAYASVWEKSFQG